VASGRIPPNGVLQAQAISPEESPMARFRLFTGAYLWASMLTHHLDQLRRLRSSCCRFRPPPISQTPAFGSRSRLNVRLSTRLSVTLAWTDPPVYGMQHSLDLVVIDSSRMPHSGNQQLASKLADVRPHQQCRTGDVKRSCWRLCRASDGLEHLFGPQGFAVVATGDIEPTFYYRL